MTKNRISAVVNTRNEAENIADCLQALRFADEIVVVDMESSDDTKKIASEYTDKIYDHKAVGYVEPARNFAIKKTIGDWILIVDADERISKSLAQKLIDIAEKGEYDFVRIPRKNMIFGQWINHSQWWPDHNIRFFKKGSVEWQNEIHSVPITYGNGLTLPSEESLAIEHLHYQNIDQFVERALRYSRQQAKELKDSGYQFDSRDFIVKPVSEFISRFFALEGYRDGLHGFVLASLQAFAIMLIYIRLWEIRDFEPVREVKFMPIWQKSFAEKGRELKYWLANVQIQHETSSLRRFFHKLVRRLNSK